MFTPTASDLQALAPEIILTIAAGLVLLVEAFLPPLRRHLSELTLISVGVAIWARVTMPLPGAVWSDALHIDPASYVDIYILVALFMTVWMAGPFLRRVKADHGEFYTLLLLAAVGAMVMAASVNLLTIFLGLELLSFLLYVLNAFLRRTAISLEAGLKYFVVGAFASAFVVYGMALLYGATATMNIVDIGASVVAAGALNPLTAVGLAMVVGGLAFKLALVPCHAWAPDVYQDCHPGHRLFVGGAEGRGPDRPAAAGRRHGSRRAVAAMGDRHSHHRRRLADPRQPGRHRAARRQTHARLFGHRPHGLCPGGGDRRRPGRRHGRARLLRRLHPDEHGRLRRDRADVRARGPAAPDRRPQGTGIQPPDGGPRPYGLPLFAGRLPLFLGFTAKFMVFRAAVNAGFVWLAVIGVLNSLLSAFYYLRVIYALYMEPLPEREPRLEPSLPIAAVATLAALGVLVLGAFPGPVIDAAASAILSLVR